MRLVFWGELVVLVWCVGEVILLYWCVDVVVCLKVDELLVIVVDLVVYYILEVGLWVLVLDILVFFEEDCEILLSECGYWWCWWLVDLLDGIKEFIFGSEEFIVNVVLVEDGWVLFGLVGVLVSGCCYYGGVGFGVWCEEVDGCV